MTRLLKFVKLIYILKYKKEFSIGNYKTKNLNNFLSEYRRMSVLSVIT